MAVCELCGKKSLTGQNIRHVHSVGWALRAQRTKRRYKPNLQKATIVIKGVATRATVCVKCMRSRKAQAGC